MVTQLALIGFGEAGQTFAQAGSWRARAFDIKTEDPAAREAKLADYRRLGVQGADALDEALADARVTLSLVTADQALAAARAAAAVLAPGALFLDANSVAPQTKAMAAQAVETAGARYVDVAIMAPVEPKRLGVPLLVSGPAAGEAAVALATLGFGDVRLAGAEIGRASAIKMIRSVMIKGLEALTLECGLAAEAAGVRADVLASLGPEWDGRFDYNLDRMMVHGARRGAEMEEVVKTLQALGVGAAMSAQAAHAQHVVGALGVTAPPEGLGGKLRMLRARLGGGPA
ncbi:MAG: NAD(P)-dependent oxidoreductase [Hyphomonadaceae bacterium]|nr:MAG: Uncharacterized protein FD160_3235 [Caulobacteraceae bacterium]MBT9447216.1 NAD(P)-dependent oxidoreductase [Hyphomonadaceae bacterium]TPW05468.1 MAG: Uncharacterized protein FD124_2133 [Alphaproteobacteria bacterium]